MPGTMRNKPAKCCCGCRLFTEHFTAANWQDKYDHGVNDAWAQSGTVISIANDTGTITSKQPFFDPEKKKAMWTFLLWTDVPTFDVSDPATYDFADYELRVKLADDGNYIFLRVSFVGLVTYDTGLDPPDDVGYRFQWSMRLYQRVAGVETAISEAITYTTHSGGFQGVDYPHLPLVYATICIDPWESSDDFGYYETPKNGYEVRSNLYLLEPDISNTQTYINHPIYSLRGDTSETAAFGDLHGVYISAGEIETGVDWITIHEYTDDCRYCECRICQHGTSPEEIELTISGIPSKDLGGGSDCSDLNGVSVRLYRNRALLKPDGDYLGSPGDPYGSSACAWRGTFYTAKAGYNQAAVVLSVEGTLYVYITPEDFAAGDDNGIQGIKVLTTGGARIDCHETLDGLVLDEASGTEWACSFGCGNCSGAATFQAQAKRKSDHVFTVTGGMDFDWTTLPAGAIITSYFYPPFNPSYDYTVVSAVQNGSEVDITVQEVIDASFPTTYGPNWYVRASVQTATITLDVRR